MANDPAFDYYGNAPGTWGRLRARWSHMPSGYRYNAALYGLAVVALTALVLEVALGESSPKFEVATQVVPLTTTTRPRPTTTFGPTTTIDPLAVTSTVPGEAAPAGSPIGPLTPTTRRAAARPAPGGGGSNTTRPASPPTSDELPTQTTFPPVVTNPPGTNPPATNPQRRRRPRCRPPSPRSPSRPSGATGSPASSAVPELPSATSCGPPPNLTLGCTSMGAGWRRNE